LIDEKRCCIPQFEVVTHLFMQIASCNVSPSPRPSGSLNKKKNIKTGRLCSMPDETKSAQNIAGKPHSKTTLRMYNHT
jgi:hypothetical protein